MLGSIVAYTVNGFFVGFGPLFQVPVSLLPPPAADYGWYVVLGAASGLFAAILLVALYGVRDMFRRIPCRPHFKPAIGGLAVGFDRPGIASVVGRGLCSDPVRD